MPTSLVVLRRRKEVHILGRKSSKTFGEHLTICSTEEVFSDDGTEICGGIAQAL